MIEHYCKANEQPNVMTGIPEVDEVLKSPAVHNQTKAILREALKHDIVDSYHDIEYALHIITQVVDNRLAALGCPIKLSLSPDQVRQELKEKKMVKDCYYQKEDKAIGLKASVVKHPDAILGAMLIIEDYLGKRVYEFKGISGAEDAVKIAKSYFA